MTKGQDRGLIGDPVTDQLDASQAEHVRHLDQGLFHRRIAEGIPLLQQVDPQHGGQWILGSATLLAGLGVVGAQSDREGPAKEPPPPAQRGLLPFGLLLGGGELVIRESKLLAAR